MARDGPNMAQDGSKMASRWLAGGNWPAKLHVAYPPHLAPDWGVIDMQNHQPNTSQALRTVCKVFGLHIRNLITLTVWCNTGG